MSSCPDRASDSLVGRGSFFLYSRAAFEPIGRHETTKGLRDYRVTDCGSKQTA